jgi:hypothetical protein
MRLDFGDTPNLAIILLPHKNAAAPPAKAK